MTCPGALPLAGPLSPSSYCVLRRHLTARSPLATLIIVPLLDAVGPVQRDRGAGIHRDVISGGGLYSPERAEQQILLQLCQIRVAAREPKSFFLT